MAKRYKTKVTRPGIQVEGRVLLPGTVLVTAGEPPKHWQSMAEIGRYEDEPRRELKTGNTGKTQQSKGKTAEDSGKE